MASQGMCRLAHADVGVGLDRRRSAAGCGIHTHTAALDFLFRDAGEFHDFLVPCHHGTSRRSPRSPATRPARNFICLVTKSTKKEDCTTAKGMVFPCVKMTVCWIFVRGAFGCSGFIRLRHEQPGMSVTGGAALLGGRCIACNAWRFRLPASEEGYLRAGPGIPALRQHGLQSSRYVRAGSRSPKAVRQQDRGIGNGLSVCTQVGHFVGKDFCPVSCSIQKMQTLRNNATRQLRLAHEGSLLGNHAGAQLQCCAADRDRPAALLHARPIGPFIGFASNQGERPDRLDGRSALNRGYSA